jgi:glycosyltransferase involved in cell wall biosynthesis
MISVILPTLDNSETLAAALEALIPAAVQGLIREVIIVDGGSGDATRAIAEGSGAHTIDLVAPVSSRLIAGVHAARFPWLLLLAPDVVLDAGWEREVDQMLGRIEAGKAPLSAAVFRLEFDTPGVRGRIGEYLISATGRVTGTAHFHQGLLVSRALYASAGGFRLESEHPVVDLSARLGRRHLLRLRSGARHADDAANAAPGSVALRHLGHALNAVRPRLLRGSSLSKAPPHQTAEI